MKNSSIPILQFTSSEAIAYPVWLELIAHLIEHKVLKLICIDEVHLFVEFGVAFHPSFYYLKDKLFSMIINKSNNNISSSTSSNTSSLKVPLLCMMATFNHHLFVLLQQMIGIYFNINNFFWNGPHSFQRRNIHISIKHSNQTFRFVKECLTTHLVYSLLYQHCITLCT